jgi:uncharacterized protein YndB with AHSA1/START domain
MMKEMQFSAEIDAPKEKVWDILWQDKTFREWAGIIDPGTYMLGELKEGGEIQFISAENGYGVTSTVTKLVPGEFALLTHTADTQDFGKRLRETDWTGTEESYSLSEKDGVTTLTVAFELPEKMEEYFKTTYPKVLDRIKELAEQL